MQDFCPNRKYEENEPKNYRFNPNLAWLFNLGWGGGGVFSITHDFGLRV